MREDFRVEFFGHTYECLDKGFGKNEPVDVVIRPEDIDIVAPGGGYLAATVTNVIFKGTFYDTFVDVSGFKWLIQTTDYHEVGDKIGISLDPDAIHVMKKSDYSEQFGDYSSYSAEYDEMEDAAEGPADEE